jgi:hypothetical protein
MKYDDDEMFIFPSWVAALCQDGDGPSSQKLRSWAKE